MSKIEVKSISKSFGNTIALKDVTIEFKENKIYGLLGRNGAGKSTLLNLITNKLFPTDGEIRIDGENVMENDKILSKIYCMSEQNLYPENMKIKEVFKWTKEFYPDFNMEYAYQLARKFNLNIKKKTRELSTGYTSIYKIIVALASNAEIVLLDEPVLGLDANHRDMFYKELLNSYIENPRTIIISTHLIEEAAKIIEEVVIIKSGEVILNDSTENVLSKGYTISGPSSVVDNYIQNKNILGYDTLGGLKTAYILDSYDKSNVPQGIEISKLDLQNLFIHMTNA